MSVPFLGEIRIFAGGATNLPQGWALCAGQSLAIADYQALYSLLGILYGGDGISTFRLPDLSGRVPIGTGQGPGLSNYPVAATGGQDTVMLTTGQMPVHTHSIAASTDPATAAQPNGTLTFAAVVAPALLYDDLTQLSGTDANFGTGAIANTGSGAAHSNLMPTMALRYMIALNGIYPTFP